MSQVKINHGTVTTMKDKAGNNTFVAVSDLEDLGGTFWTYTAAAFYLWLIEARVMGRKYRLGL